MSVNCYHIYLLTHTFGSVCIDIKKEKKEGKLAANKEGIYLFFHSFSIVLFLWTDVELQNFEFDTAYLKNIPHTGLTPSYNAFNKAICQM